MSREHGYVSSGYKECAANDISAFIEEMSSRKDPPSLSFSLLCPILLSPPLPALLLPSTASSPNLLSLAPSLRL